jgi:hypothetical protein
VLEKLIKIGAKVVSHGRYIAFQMAEVETAGIIRRRLESTVIWGMSAYIVAEEKKRSEHSRPRHSSKYR